MEKSGAVKSIELFIAGWLSAKWLLASLVVITLSAARAQDLSWESVGARVGASASSRAHNFHEAEPFVNLNLPWSWRLESRSRIQSRLDLSAGWLADPGANAAMVTLGPSLIWTQERFPVSFEMGVSPTYISTHTFETKNLGTEFQFTSHAGLNLELSAHFRLGYRFQHMSNAGLAKSNPGLNLNMFALSYVF